ncbi:MAG: hypothetical protein AAB408_01700 [Patescibacteria group bacterium]
MKLSKQQFDSAHREQRLVLTLIGMSNVGKSFWSQKLADVGFSRYCCDDLIETKLAPQLLAQGYKGIADVAAWLGLPYEPQFKKHQQ